MPKIRPAPNSDDTDVDYGNVGERVGLDDFLAKCKNQLGSLPPLIPRNVRHRKNSLGNEGNFFFDEIWTLVLIGHFACFLSIFLTICIYGYSCNLCATINT